MNPLVSIAIPVYEMKNKDFFLKRCLDSIYEQTYTNYEIVMTECGKSSENTNEAIRQSKGYFIKILHMDDFFAHKDALKLIVEAFRGDWLVTGCTHTTGNDRFNDHYATYNDKIHTGLNTIGAPSVLAIRNGIDVWFDEESVWLLDCLFYKEMYDKYGPPDILDDINVVIGIHDGQATNLLTEEQKENEVKKYV